MESNIIYKTNNNKTAFTIASPVLINKINYCRNRFIKDNFDQENYFLSDIIKFKPH